MNAQDATAEVFWTAFKALPPKVQEAVVDRLLRDEAFMESQRDLAAIESPSQEGGADASLDAYLTQRQRAA